jgi:hypothetical protein
MKKNKVVATSSSLSSRNSPLSLIYAVTCFLVFIWHTTMVDESPAMVP